MSEKYLQVDRCFVQECEARFTDALVRLSDTICQKEGLRLCTLTGPTCSGKTTAASMLVKRMAAYGKLVHVVSIDDFYYNTEYLRQKSEEKGLLHIDYDSVETIDLDALRVFTEEIFSSKTVHAPIFDFRHGSRTGYRELEIGERDVFLFEGIQAAYPEVTALFAPHGSSSIYIAPQKSITAPHHVFEPNEIRFLRRIVRDYNFRKTSPDFTMGMWDGVRRNEELHIFPYVGNCEHTVDSTMPYELGILKPYLEKILGEIAKESPYRAKADAILSSLSGVESVPTDWLSEDSLYREFV